MPCAHRAPILCLKMIHRNRDGPHDTRCAVDALATLSSVLSLYPRLGNQRPPTELPLLTDADVLRPTQRVAQPGALRVLAHQARCPYNREMLMVQHATERGGHVLLGEVTHLRKHLIDIVLEEVGNLRLAAALPGIPLNDRLALERRADELVSALWRLLEPYQRTLSIIDA